MKKFLVAFNKTHYSLDFFWTQGKLYFINSTNQIQSKTMSRYDFVNKLIDRNFITLDVYLDKWDTHSAITYIVENYPEVYL